VFAAACCAQKQPAFRMDVDLVTIPCVVVDSHGAPVWDLRRDEFRVFDNDVRRTIDNLWVDTDVPLTLTVLIDQSVSQGDRRAEHRQTALEVVQRIRLPGDQIFFVSVDHEVRMWGDVAGTQRGELVGQPCPLSQCGGSPLWNAVYDVARLKLNPAKGAKAVLFLTDGIDSGSTHTLNQSLDELHKAGATAYAIHYPSDSGAKFAPDLYRLTAATGGTRFQPPGDAYDPIVTRLQTDLRRRYVLGFRPEQLSFGQVRHQVRVEVTRPDLTVRARNTYFLIPR
jgi:Ca-activated chloride channel family protein